MNHTIRSFALTALAAAMLAACSSAPKQAAPAAEPPPAQPAAAAEPAPAPAPAPVEYKTKVAGKVSFAARKALPADAAVIVQVVDVTDAKNPMLVGEQTVPTGGAKPPYAYAVGYDAAKVDAKHRYEVAARIESQGKVLFATDASQRVVLGAKGAKRDITVKQVR